MPLAFGDRVQETTATTGTGTLTLAGAVAGFQAFSSVLSNADTTYYTIVNGNNWEVGVGTYTTSGTTLSRDTVFASSSSGAKISLVGSSTVFITPPAGRTVMRNASNVFALSAGTTSIPPLLFQSGTNINAATGGAMEYDGKVPYFTPQSTERGVVAGMQFYRLNSALAGTNVNTAQTLLGAGCTLSASTVYAFEIQATMLKTAGTTSHTVNFGWGGTATVNNIYADARVLFFAGSVNAQITSTNYNALVLTQTTAVATTPASTTAGLLWSGTIKGTVSINAGGTFIPQYTLSAAPGGAYTTQIGSYMLIYPIGASGANTSVGTWA